METSTTLGKELRSRIGRIAMVIGLAFVIGGVGAGPALADGGHDHGDRGQHHERHDNGRHENHYRDYRYAPPSYYHTRDYDRSPNYYYTPPPVYYDPPPPSEGWNFIFPFGR